MPAILIKNGIAITMDRERNVIENASVLIRDDRIAAFGDGDEISANVNLDEVIDATSTIKPTSLWHVCMVTSMWRRTSSSNCRS